MSARLFPPVRPGDVPRCPNGCSDYPQDGMPDHVPYTGYWGTCCMTCGWVAMFRARYGDRPQDLYYVVDENVPPDLAADWRAQTDDFKRRLAQYG